MSVQCRSWGDDVVDGVAVSVVVGVVGPVDIVGLVGLVGVGGLVVGV